MDYDDTDDDINITDSPGHHPGGGSGGDSTGGLGSGFAWESSYKRTWDDVTASSEPLDAQIRRLTTDRRRARYAKAAGTMPVHRGLVRHTVVVLDLSQASRDADLPPTRAHAAANALGKYAREYFDQNPLAQMALVATHNERAARVVGLSSAPAAHAAALTEYMTALGKRLAEAAKNATDLGLANASNASALAPGAVAAAATSGGSGSGGGAGGGGDGGNTFSLAMGDAGEPSLQNALELVRKVLAHVPRHGTREVIMVVSALTSCDPGNIADTLAAVARDGIRVSVVSLAAEVHVLKKLSEMTGGEFAVAMDEAHLKELLLAHVPPPPITAQTSALNASNLMRMGFPEYSAFASAVLCACHAMPIRAGHTCPRCASPICTVPSDCPVCGLTLVLSPHLARSYHHLFPVPIYQEVMRWQEVKSQECAACAAPLPAGPTAAELALLVDKIPPTDRYQCPRCAQQVCIECDVYVHEVLHNCPMCSEGVGNG
ncbi:Ssl1-like-domain-containing protein [Blastocladiella britannica]|nr:Ssl1-like-domain-containing protein [Blastocladiella britannica]